MRSPTSASPAKSEVVQAPPWLARLLTPLFARHIARELSEKHPGLSPQEMAAKMRAELQAKMGRAPNADEARLIEDVAARFPKESVTPVEKPVSAWVLVAANLVPLAGVLFWGWDVFALLALFWMENVIIGVFFILRMLCLDPRDPRYGRASSSWCRSSAFTTACSPRSTALRVPTCSAASATHLRACCCWSRRRAPPADFGLWLPLAVLLASHAFSFVWNYLFAANSAAPQLPALMAKPYGRVVVLHVAIILGGIGAPWRSARRSGRCWCCSR